MRITSNRPLVLGQYIKAKFFLTIRHSATNALPTLTLGRSEIARFLLTLSKRAPAVTCSTMSHLIVDVGVDPHSKR